MEEQIIPIYSGTNINWAGAGSGSGTNLEACADKVKPPCVIFSDKNPYDPLTGKGAKVAETDPKKLKEYNLEHLIGVPRLILNGFELCGSWEKAKGNPAAEAEYMKKSLVFNQMIVDELHRFEDKQGFGIDLIILGGYMRLILEPLLKAFPDKMVNVHPSTLEYAANTPPSNRKLTGDDAVYDAVKAGELFTRSSVIIVDEKPDHGEILTQGRDVNVKPQYSIIKSYGHLYVKKFVSEHQEEQKKKSDWPALTTALKLISEGRLALGTEKVHHNEWRGVYLDGKQLPYEGLRL